jgi:hypothetical protein
LKYRIVGRLNNSPGIDYVLETENVRTSMWEELGCYDSFASAEYAMQLAQQHHGKVFKEVDGDLSSIPPSIP